MSGTFNYARMAATATRLIAKFGRTITQRTYTIGTYDPATGTTSSTQVDITRTAAVLDFGQGQTLVRGTLIQGGDKRLLMDSSVPPSMQDNYQIDATEYVTVSIGEVNPGGKSVMYDIHLST
jgi:hypothetical protein